jgi:two-component sensor histidine kinase
VASLAELARLRTDLEGHQFVHLQRLVGTWGLLADFCFADLLLYAPVRGELEDSFIVLGQIRPATTQTVYRSDWVGTVVTADERPLVANSFRSGEIVEATVDNPTLKEQVRVLAIPVRWEGEVIGVVTRESALTFGRQPGELERVYVEIFNRFARMIAAGTFPFATDDPEPEEAPRVGDGVMLLDRQGYVVYTSPNAVSALHRVGVHANTEGMRLGELGLDEAPVRRAFALPGPVIEELEQGPEVTVLLRCIPLLDQGEVSGAVLLLRDISELRRRDRLLLSKDATIREIHHRVKNNLQTISSLLRLTGRRLESPEAKAAIEESVRRVRSIALVHEILSREAGEDVPFVEIVRPVCRMVEEAFHTPDRPVRCRVEGDAGNLPAQVATPLAVVLNELLQNAFDHAYPEGKEIDAGEVVLSLRRDHGRLDVQVVDDGAGLPDGFDLDTSMGLGLSIVRTLVTSELAGTIELRTGEGLADRPGTIVELKIPLEVSLDLGEVR